MPSIEELKKSLNIADLLDDNKIGEIGDQVVKGYQIDEDSRAEWKESVDEAMKIAKQLMEHKTFPWDGASNIKYPLITEACINYASRTLPEIIQNERVVKASICGMDKDDVKYRRAARVSSYMSYQLLTESSDWENSTDSLLSTLPVLGTVFKKTYYDPIEGRNKSDLCIPDKVCVNYHTQSIESARRITHIITLYSNDIVERQRAGLFNEDISIASLMEKGFNDSKSGYNEDADCPIDLLEQHCYLDLDEDGYKEPYVVTVHQHTKQVLRIVARFKNIEKKDKKILKITPDQYFTDFHFIRSPDGGFYSMGFGTLLLPINKSINTLINQLTDAGTLSVTQGGFLGRGLRIKNGEIKVNMHKWQVLDAASGTDIGSNVFPFPVREPSSTLMSLLSLLMQVGKDLSSTTDVMSGQQNATNVANGTINQLIEQGSKVFVAINKRVYRGLKKEYQKLYELNTKYLKQAQYVTVLDDPEADVKVDFAYGDMDIYPVADPAVSSETQRLVRAGMIQALRTADPREADTLFLQALQLDQSMIDRLLPKADPNAPPPLEQQKLEAEVYKLKAEIADMSAKAKLESERNQLEMAKIQKANEEADSRIQESASRSWKTMHDAKMNETKMVITSSKMRSEQQLKAATLASNNDIKQAEVLIKAKEVSKPKEGLVKDEDK